MPIKRDPEAIRRRRRDALGVQVRELRTARGWTQEALAHETGFDRKSVNRIETGAYSPALDRVFVLADTLGVTVSHLLEGID